MKLRALSATAKGCRGPKLNEGNNNHSDHTRSQIHLGFLFFENPQWDWGRFQRQRSDWSQETWLKGNTIILVIHVINLIQEILKKSWMRLRTCSATADVLRSKRFNEGYNYYSDHTRGDSNLGFSTTKILEETEGVFSDIWSYTPAVSSRISWTKPWMKPRAFSATTQGLRSRKLYEGKNHSCDHTRR